VYKRFNSSICYLPHKMYSTIIRSLTNRTGDNQDLLSPALDDSPHTTIYSTGALVAAAFFGGGAAVCVMGLLNSHRLKRLGQDWFWVVLGVVCSFAALAVSVQYFGLEDSQSTREMRMANRGVGFLLVGFFYWVHRAQYRGMTATGVTPPKPWIPVIAAALIGFLATAGMMVVAGQVMG